MKTPTHLRRLYRHMRNAFARPDSQPVPAETSGHPALSSQSPETAASGRTTITAGEIDGLAAALDALPTDWNTNTRGHKYIETQENGISHRYVIGTVCKGKSRINFPQEPTRLGDDTN